MCDHSNVKQIITRWREPTSTSHNTFILHTFTPQVAFQTFPVYFNHLNLHITATMLCWFLSDDFSETFIVSWQGLIIVCVGDFKSSKNAWHGDWQNFLPQVDPLDSPLVLARPFSYHHYPQGSRWIRPPMHSCLPQSAPIAFRAERWNLQFSNNTIILDDYK